VKKGDLVETIDDQLQGEILSIHGEQVEIRTTEGFSMRFSKRELVVVHKEGLSGHTHVPDHVLSEKQHGARKRKGKLKIKEEKGRKKVVPPMEVDLHIGQLVRSTKGMTNHDMRTLQLETAKRQLEFALRKRILRLVFIHGVGDGILKEDLESLLRRYDDRLTYYDADYKKYGRGATEVRFFQNPRSA